MLKNPIKTICKKHSDIILICLCVTAVFAVLWSFTGHWPWKAQPYNSYILQAQSWLQGRLDLGKDYPYLELAIFNNKYFVSFPPFPSYIMLPFVMLGWDSCDSMIAFAISILGVVYTYKLTSLICKNSSKQFIALMTLLVTVGSNWLMTSHNAWVWFIAQNMAFTLSIMSLYYALKNNAGLSLALWACAVGCRPLQAVFIPVLLYLIYKAHKSKNPTDRIFNIIKKRWTAAIPMLVIAISYMVLNYARFGNIAEFGHNYLPEFTRVTTGQFNKEYLLKNLPSLFRLPSVSDGKLSFPMSDGMCMFIVSPIFISYIIYMIYSFINNKDRDLKLLIMALAVAVIELFLIIFHKTMGGAHFGNRYTNDILPVIFLGTLLGAPKDEKFTKFNYVFLFWGFALNLAGILTFYTR